MENERYGLRYMARGAGVARNEEKRVGHRKRVCQRFADLFGGECDHRLQRFAKRFRLDGFKQAVEEIIVFAVNA